MSDFRTQNGILRALNPGEKQGWTGGVYLKNGEVVDMSKVAYINAWNPFVGLAVEYGLRQDLLYDQFMVNEKFGGGNAVGCFFVRRRFLRKPKIYVGLTCEKRNDGQEQWELPRFFCGTANETRMESFQQNLEKDHFDFTKVSPMNCPINCNSAYNFTADDTEGLQLFYVKLQYTPSRFFYNPDDDSYVFADLAPIERDKSTKRIVGSRFFEIGSLCANQDVFTSAWVGKFWTHVRAGLIKL